MFTITVKGGKQAIKALERDMEKKLTAIHQANIYTALDIETDAKLRMTKQGAVDTGRARASIHTETGDNKAHGVRWKKPYYDNKAQYTDDRGISYDGSLNVEIDAAEAVVGTNVGYAPFIEFGTVHMAARPYLTPAAKAAQSKHLLRIEEALK